MSEAHAQGAVFAFLAFVPVDVVIHGGVERFEEGVEPVVGEVDLRVTCVPRGIPAVKITEIREGVTVRSEPAPGDQYVPTGLQFVRVVRDVAAVKGGADLVPRQCEARVRACHRGGRQVQVSFRQVHFQILTRCEKALDGPDLS